MPPRAPGTIGWPRTDDDARRRGFASCVHGSGAPGAHRQRVSDIVLMVIAAASRAFTLGLSERRTLRSIRRPGRVESAPGRSHRTGPEPLGVPETPSDRGSLDLLDPDEWNERADRAARERAERRRARQARHRGRRAAIRARGAQRRTTPGRHALGPAADRLRRGAGAGDAGRSGRAVAFTAPSRSVAGVRRQELRGGRDRGARRALPGTGRAALPAAQRPSRGRSQARERDHARSRPVQPRLAVLPGRPGAAATDGRSAGFPRRPALSVRRPGSPRHAALAGHPLRRPGRRSWRGGAACWRSSASPRACC